MSTSKYWTADEVLVGVDECSASVRGTYPKYTVKADGETATFSRRDALDRYLGIIYSTAPKVFINAGKGITIDFDNGGAL